MPLAQIHPHSTDEGKRRGSVSLFAACHPEVLTLLIMLLASQLALGLVPLGGFLGAQCKAFPRGLPGCPDPRRGSLGSSTISSMSCQLLRPPDSPPGCSAPLFPMHLINGGCAATHRPLAVSCLSLGYVSSCPRRHTERISVFPI